MRRYSARVSRVGEYITGNIDTAKLGTYGWYGLITYILIWDLLAPETLSHAFDRGMKHPTIRWIVLGVWGYVTAHLLKFVPERYDPLCILADQFARSYKEVEKAMEDVIDEITDDE